MSISSARPVEASNQNSGKSFWRKILKPFPGFHPAPIEVDVSNKLSAAVRSGKLSKARMLLEAGYDVNTKDKAGNSLLHLAAWRGDFRTAQFLIKHGANVHAKNEEHSGVHTWISRFLPFKINLVLFKLGYNVNDKGGSAIDSLGRSKRPQKNSRIACTTWSQS